MKSEEKTTRKSFQHIEKENIITGFRYGSVIKLEPQMDFVWIDYQGNPFKERLPARIDNPKVTFELLEEAIQYEHLIKLRFDEGDPSKPLVDDVLFSATNSKSVPAGDISEKTIHVKADRIVLEGNKEVIIRCGEVEMRLLAAKGQLVQEAKTIRSMAKKRYRIQGGSVLVN